MSEHMPVIERFGIGIGFDHEPNQKELELVNAVCNSTDVQEGLEVLRSTDVPLSRDSLSLLCSCAVALWQDLEQPLPALVVSRWALEATRIASDHEAEASTLYMHVGLLLANHRYGEATEAVKSGRKLCAEHSELQALDEGFAAAESECHRIAAEFSTREDISLEIKTDAHIRKSSSHKPLIPL